MQKSTTDKSPHQPLPHTITLASLVKGEVLSPEKIRATTGGIASPPLRFAPHSYRPLSKVRCCRRKKFGRLPEELPHQPLPRTNPSKNRTIPRKSPTPLPPLSKGGGLTARHKPLYCCFLLVPRPPFLFTKPFCRQDGGIATSPRFAPHSYRPLSKVRCCRRKNSGDYRRDCHTYRTLSVSLTPPLTIPHSAPNPRKTAPSLRLALYPCLPSKKGRWLDGIAKPLFYIIFIL